MTYMNVQIADNPLISTSLSTDLSEFSGIRRKGIPYKYKSVYITAEWAFPRLTQ